MTSTTRSRLPRRRWATLAATLVCAAGLLAGCSAGGESGADMSAADEAGAVAPDVAADGGAEAGVVGSAVESATQEADRQVVQTGSLRVTVDDPQAAADAVVALAERTGGRVDSRTEHAATDAEAGTASLTIRVPSDEVTATVDAVRELGRVDSIDLDAQDVTAAAQDLDARIRGLELSVARMEDLLARTTTTKDVVDAENALTERQTRLEELQAQRARLADAVALSTLTVELYGPGIVPAAADPGPRSFLDGLAVGWQSFVVALRAVVVVVGVLLPWLAFVGAVVAAWVAAVRWWRRRHPVTGTDDAVVTGAGGPGLPPAAAQASADTTA
ncbi:DUF4349 domain-containing protein [Cellulomonas fimi]|uniref:DUF4349 domain-containing protein n=1 Tax=Cellulomonas fimi (strain ATCC 484 / DSM 20113 / JCM 1341 / CCUG 24087 / LMG 16345 / NBRC 15513 / NCIMB 8980 / NCTC 7547 / NRS-133) TaxID=590998 RepID=F4H416_CELFA|nr:DUF4349 domain-containing protein [Cellulomonas fimi]AEE45368.1 hypothetical protein Celf_1233 [Cellulomonas fimi ATCC 484]NNH08153.1 DUF4349 domain-containing protein [Cellulomonas fimi]VEH29135.1 Uncharacterised protein [Cellulomonas fimi]